MEEDGRELEEEAVCAIIAKHFHSQIYLEGKLQSHFGKRVHYPLIEYSIDFQSHADTICTLSSFKTIYREPVFLLPLIYYHRLTLQLN